MARGRPLQPLMVTPLVREELEASARSRSLPHGLVRRAKIILLAADGLSNKSIAARGGVSGAVVSVRRRRYLAQGWLGLYDEQRPGGPRTISDAHRNPRTCYNPRLA